MTLKDRISALPPERYARSAQSSAKLAARAAEDAGEPVPEKAALILRMTLAELAEQQRQRQAERPQAPDSTPIKPVLESFYGNLVSGQATFATHVVHDASGPLFWNVPLIAGSFDESDESVSGVSNDQMELFDEMQSAGGSSDSGSGDQTSAERNVVDPLRSYKSRDRT